MLLLVQARCLRGGSDRPAPVQMLFDLHKIAEKHDDSNMSDLLEEMLSEQARPAWGMGRSSSTAPEQNLALRQALAVGQRRALFDACPPDLLPVRARLSLTGQR